MSPSPTDAARPSCEATALSVVVVSWNTRELLERCLHSLIEEIDRSGLVNTETIVVDNCSTDGSVDMVRGRFPSILLIENTENRGFALANNQAIRKSRGRFILLLNSDTELHPGALASMIEFLESSPNTAGCGPMLLNPDGSLQESCQPMLTPWREFWRLSFLDRIWPRATYCLSRWDHGHAHEVEVLKGACLLLRRQALDTVGLLDTRYFMYTEEADLCYRLQQAGWVLHWVPAARVMHHSGASTRQVEASMYVQLYRSKLQFFRKAGGKRQARLFRLLVACAYLPRLLLAGAAAPFSKSLAQRARIFRQLLAELWSM
jgi:N-acetylglucosaminyl-diphospho-decaprenol L-rhamnosyltransferase